MSKALTMFASTLVLGALLAGCSVSQPTAPTGIQAQEPAVDVIGTFQVTSAAGYQLMSTETAYHLGNIDHVMLSVQKLDGGTWAGVTGFEAKKVARADLGQPLTLKNLRMGTQYKIVAKTYADAAGTDRIDNGAAADNEAAFTTPTLNVVAERVNTAAGDSISTATLPVTIKVKLKDKTFAGQASSGSGVSV
ncbi:MAG: hypothetical protein ACLGIN_03680, partial [Candidatus Sericytochromatia bacterium]